VHSPTCTSRSTSSLPTTTKSSCASPTAARTSAPPQPASHRQTRRMARHRHLHPPRRPHHRSLVRRRHPRHAGPTRGHHPARLTVLGSPEREEWLAGAEPSASVERSRSPVSAVAARPYPRARLSQPRRIRAQRYRTCRARASNYVKRRHRGSDAAVSTSAVTSFTASSRSMPLVLSECHVENASAWRNAPVRSSFRAPRSRRPVVRISTASSR